jgi:hypothetical protein
MTDQSVQMTVSARMFTLDGRTETACSFHRKAVSGRCTAPATLEIELFDGRPCRCSNPHAECEFGQGLDCLNADACTNPHHDRRIRRLACERHARALLDLLSSRHQVNAA